MSMAACTFMSAAAPTVRDTAYMESCDFLFPVLHTCIGTI